MLDLLVEERRVSVGLLAGREKIQSREHGPDFGDFRSGVAAAEYPHALLAIPWARSALLVDVCKLFIGQGACNPYCAVPTEREDGGLIRFVTYSDGPMKRNP